MPGVGGTHTTWFLQAVEGERVGRKLVTPIRFFEVLLDLAGLSFEFICSPGIPQGARKNSPVPLGGKDITLYLAQRDWRLSRSAIRMKHGIAGVLPTLL